MPGATRSSSSHAPGPACLPAGVEPSSGAGAGAGGSAGQVKGVAGSLRSILSCEGRLPSTRLSSLQAATLWHHQVLQATGWAELLRHQPLPHPRMPRRDASAWWSSWAPLHTMPKQERLQLLVEENEWKNELVMWLFPEPVRAAMPRIVQTWVRCAVLCAAVYFAMSGLWVYYAYHCFGDKLFKPGTMPEVSAVMEQIKVGRAWVRAHSLCGWACCFGCVLRTTCPRVHSSPPTLAPRTLQVSTKAIPLYSMLPAITEFCAEKVRRPGCMHA